MIRQSDIALGGLAIVAVLPLLLSGCFGIGWNERPDGYTIAGETWGAAVFTRDEAVQSIYFEAQGLTPNGYNVVNGTTPEGWGYILITRDQHERLDHIQD